MKRFYNLLIKPRNNNDDLRRREYITTILLLGSVLLCTLALFDAAYGYLIKHSQTTGAVSLGLIFGVWVFFTGLYTLARLRFYQIAAKILILFYFISATYTLYVWGVQVAQGWLIYALVIIMAGVMVSARFAILTSLAVIAAFLSVDYLETMSLHTPDQYWLGRPLGNDVVVAVATFGLITLVSWLFNRQIESSFQRVRASEKALREERDQLEVKVEERTQQLRRFAEVGRMTSGLIHDLVTPLSTISLNLEQLSSSEQAHLIERAQSGIQAMENYVKATRRQINGQNQEAIMVIDQEINQIISIFHSRSERDQILLEAKLEKRIHSHGDSAKFQQVIANILSNAFDAYEEIPLTSSNRKIEVRLIKNDKDILITVGDQGVGIKPEVLTEVFIPFFTTKGGEKGLGIGLYLSKEIIEKDFKGQISAISTKSKGTVFTISIPLHK